MGWIFGMGGENIFIYYGVVCRLVFDYDVVMFIDVDVKVDVVDMFYRIFDEDNIVL